MIKNLFLAFLIFTSIVLLPRATFAKTDPERAREEKLLMLQERIEQKNALMEQKRLETNEKIQEKRASQTARLENARKQRAQSFWRKVEVRFSAAILRLEKLITRIEERVAVIEGQNPEVVTSGVTADLNEAKTLLGQAKAKLETLDPLFGEILESESPGEDFATIRDSMQDLKSDLVSIHTILVQTIGDIKGLRVGNTNRVSPSVTVVVTPTP